MASPACRGEEPNTYSQGSKVDKSKMSINFFISEGTLQIINAPSGNYSIEATSGLNKHMNDPDSTNLSNEGPIPIGKYHLMPKELSDPNHFRDYVRNLGGYSDWGDWRITIHPDSKTDTHGRKGFFIHGGQRPGSKGCIDVGGGMYGNEQTDRLKKDIIKSKQQNIKLTVIR